MRFPFWRRKERESELDAEIQSHLQIAEREHVARGENSYQARDSARRELGNLSLVKDVTRDMWGLRWLLDFVQDARYGTRMLRANPGFTAVAICTLALGIGANTAIFSLINAVILRNLPVQHPEQLFQIASNGPTGLSSAFSYPAFLRVRDENHSFAGVLVSGTPGSYNATIDGKAEVAHVALVSGNFFTVLGVNATIGRTFTADEDKSPRANPVAVISYDYWNRRFRKDPNIVTKQIVLRGTPLAILGVAPRNFFGISVGSSPDIYIPMMMEPVLRARSILDNGSFVWTQVMGRLKPGITKEQAVADLGIAFSHIQSDDVEKWMTRLTPRDRENYLARRVLLVPAGNGISFDVRQQFSNPLLILMGVSGLVLLIACANVANLLLARATARRKEIAIKLAIGAGQLRILRQLITESLMLAFAGGVLGFVVALWAMDGVVALMSFGRGQLTFDLHPDLRMFAFTAGISLLVALVFGLAPAMRATHLDVAPALKETSHAAGPGKSRNAIGKALVVSQVAISLILLFGTGLLVRTLINLEKLDPGFDRNNVLLFEVNSSAAGYKGPAATLLQKQIVERLEAIPGVRSASVYNMAPVTGGGGWTSSVQPEGYIPRENEDLTVNLNSVGPHYFETIGTPILRGRSFSQTDTEKTPIVVVINQTMARYFFGETNPIGKKIGWYGDAAANPTAFTIIGVSKDAKYETLREEAPRTMFLDALQGENPFTSFGVRTVGNPSAFATQIREAVQSINDGIRVGQFETLSDHVDSTLGHERLMVILCSLFAGLAGLLACIGLYGVTSYGVARRRGEIGIRMALGAQRSDVLWMIQRETLRLVIIGIAIGLPAGIVTSRLISSTLFNIGSYDPITIAAVSLLMTGVALLAGFLPSRKASRVDPIEALRNE